MNYSRHDKLTILSFLQSNDLDYEAVVEDQARILTTDEYVGAYGNTWLKGNRSIEEAIYYDITGFIENELYDIWIVYDDEKLGLRLGIFEEQFMKWYKQDASRIYIVMLDKIN